MKKKISVHQILFSLSMVLALAALVIAYVSCTDEGFGMPQLPLIAGLTAAALILGCLVWIVTAKTGDGPVNTALLLATVVVLGIAVYMMVRGKEQVFGTTLFSDLERDYEPAMRAAMLGIASIAGYLASAILVCVCSFFRFGKSNQ